MKQGFRSRLGFIIENLEFVAADTDDIAMPDFLFLDGNIIDVGTIGAIQVPDAYIEPLWYIMVGFKHQHGMLTTHDPVFQLQVIATITTNSEITTAYLDIRDNNAITNLF